MGSVNATTRMSLPPASVGAASDGSASTGQGIPRGSLLNTLDSMGAVTGAVLDDMGTRSGLTHHDEAGGPVLNIGSTAGIGGLALGASGVAGVAKELGRASATNMKPTASMMAASSGQILIGGMLRVSPTLASAVIGPAAADGITYLAPNLVKKHVDTSRIYDSAARAKADKDNQYSRYSRIVAGGAVVGAIALGAYLLKPDLFRGIGGNLVSSKVIQGSTDVITSRGVTHSLTGVLNDTAVLGRLADLGKLGAGETATIVRTTGPAARSAVLTNRVAVGAAGTLATTLLANKAAGSTGDERRNWSIAAASVGAATLGGVVGIGALTRASEKTGGLLSKTGLLHGPGKTVVNDAALAGTAFKFPKVNMDWIKSYGAIAGITAVPAGTAAGQYYNLFGGDFETITRTGSPWRR